MIRINLRKLVKVADLKRQQSRLAPVKFLPMSTDEIQLQKYCLSLLRAHGWTILSPKNTTTEPLIEKGLVRCRLCFVCAYRMGSPAMRADWAYLRAFSGLPIVVVAGREPDPDTVQYCREIRLLIIHYIHLVNLEERLML